MNIAELIEKHEGWEPTMYHDTVGVPTIGFGFNLQEQEMPYAVGVLWLSHIIEDCKEELAGFDWYEELDPDRQAAIMSMYYSLGRSRFLGFKKMIAALEEHDYDRAAREMLDSKWADQVGYRATELAGIVSENDNIGI